MEDKPERVYIEDISSEEYKKNRISDTIEFPLQPYSPNLPMKRNEHIFEFKTPEQKKELLDYLQNKDYLADKELIEFIDAEAPELNMYFAQAPIAIDELKEFITLLFGDVPANLFEGETYFKIIVKILNHILKKETCAFVLQNIYNGKLIYNDKYYPISYSGFYRVGKFNHHISTYFMIIGLWEELLENHYWKVMFSKQEAITIENMNDIRNFYGFLGRQYNDFAMLLAKHQFLLKQEILWTKRTAIRPHPNYYAEVRLANRNIAKIIPDLKNQRERLYARKKSIEDMLNRRIEIKKDKIETLFSGKLGFLKYKIKEWAGVFK